MKKLGILFTATLSWQVFALASPIPAEVLIKNFALEKKGEFVTVTIYGSQPFQFTHATEEAKGGKPFRVYLDCQGARLGLPQSSFHNLPGQTVTALRTSQYQEVPQNIVRVVLDCSRPVTYKVQNQGNWVEVSISSPTEAAFGRWEAVKPGNVQLASEEAAKTDRAQTPGQTTTPAGNKDSIQALSEAKGKTDKPKPDVEVKPQAAIQKTDLAKKEEKIQSPIAETNKIHLASTDQTTKLQVSPQKKTEEQPTKTTLVTQNDKATEPSLTKETQPSDKKSETAAPASKSETGLPLLSQKPGVQTQDQKPLVLAHKTEVDQWAGYPQREVVKYASQGRRDPFSSLFERMEDSEFGVAPLPSVENLKLVGVLQSLSQNLALLEDSRGFGYILQAGDKIKEGRVLRVDQDQVIFQVSEYGWTRNVTLELYKQSK